MLNQQDSDSVAPGNWRTYSNSRLGFSFKYPPVLTLRIHSCAEDLEQCFGSQQDIVSLEYSHQWMDIYYSSDIASAFANYDNGLEVPEDNSPYFNLASYFSIHPHNTSTIPGVGTTFITHDADSHTIWFEHKGIFAITITDPTIFHDLTHVGQFAAWENAILSTILFK
jgi:hypothetical protein